MKRPDLEEALLVLPLWLVEALVARLAKLLMLGKDPELCTRCAAFLVQVLLACYLTLEISQAT